jgi:hypothetical protein
MIYVYPLILLWFQLKMSSASEILQYKYDSLVVENRTLEQELSRLEAKVGQLNLQG